MTVTILITDLIALFLIAALLGPSLIVATCSAAVALGAVIVGNHRGHA